MKISIKQGLSYFGGVLLILLILFSFAYVLSPWIIKWQANNWFEGQGLNSSIEDIEINITDGEFIIRGLDVRDAGDQQRLHVGHALLQVGMRDLFSNRVSVEKIDIGDVFIDVAQDEPGAIKVAGIRVGPGSAQDEMAAPVTGKQEAGEDKIPVQDDSEIWRIIVQNIQFNNIRLCFRAASSENFRAFHDCVTVDGFNWTGRTKYPLYDDADRALNELEVAFTSTLTGFTVRDHQLQRTVMRFDSLQFNDVSVNGINEARIKLLSLDRYQALQKPVSGESPQPEYLLSSDQLQISDVKLDKLSVMDITTLNVKGIKADVLVDKDGRMEIQKAISEFSPLTGPPAQAETEVEKTGEKDALIIRLGELLINGGSSVNVRDESVSPVFSNRISEIRLSVKDVDMSNIKGETQVELSLVVGEHGKIETKGKMVLFDKKPSVDMDARVVGINIGEFDAYAKQIVQHKVKSGHLDAEFKVKIDQGNLDTKAAVKLHKFYVESLGEKEASQYKEKLGVPLGAALSLLRDRDDSISIKMPVTGDVENPDFSLGDIIRKVSAVAIKEAVINYYTPFGLVKLLTKGFDLATALRFEPVIFEAGDADLDTGDREKLDKLVTLLKERPGVHLVVCGYATQQDFNFFYPEQAAKLKKVLEKNRVDKESSDTAAVVEDKVEFPILDLQRKKMESLASNRSKVVKQYLVDQHKIGSNRLIICNPKFDIAETGKMRTEISI